MDRRIDLLAKMRKEGIKGLIISKEDKEVYVAAWALGRMARVKKDKIRPFMPKAFARLYFDTEERWRLADLWRRVKQLFDRPMSWETFLENLVKEGMRTAELKMLKQQAFYHDWDDRDHKRKKTYLGHPKGGRGKTAPMPRHRWGRPVAIPAWAIAKGAHELGTSRNSRVPSDLLDPLDEED